MTKEEKVYSIIACPACKSPSLIQQEAGLLCNNCQEIYPLLDGIPLLLEPKSRIRESYLKKYNEQPGFKDIIRRWLIRPQERVWSRRAIRTIQELLDKVNPDDQDHIVYNMGSGGETVFKRIFSRYSDLIRIGLPHKGNVDILADAVYIPLKDNSVDLIFSSSVIEHLYDPETAVQEIHRVLKPGGMIYAEIPFIRAFHMIPIDYQRYTISGIEQLFKRHHFELIDKGISSGPFTAWALLTRDFFVSIAPGGIASFAARFLFSWLVQPVKYLDRLVENAKWAPNLSCNLFCLGKKSE